MQERVDEFVQFVRWVRGVLAVKAPAVEVELSEAEHPRELVEGERSHDHWLSGVVSARERRSAVWITTTPTPMRASVPRCRPTSPLTDTQFRVAHRDHHDQDCHHHDLPAGDRQRHHRTTHAATRESCGVGS